MADDLLRIANCSGFFGDRMSAAQEMVTGGDIDVLTGDYLAELTMAILWRQRLKDASRGYVGTFLTQMEEVLSDVMQREIKVVSNAGGLNPQGLAGALEDLSGRLGLSPVISVVGGDDLMGRIDELVEAGYSFENLESGEPLAGVEPLTANAYLGGWGIAEALKAGADIVICGRVTDASLVVGPCAWHFGWERTDWDELAGAVVAGHILECGCQCTGGNYSFADEIEDSVRPGFPLAEMRQDGSSVITKHPSTGGAVTVGTVTAQLLYEIDTPRYLNPDVTARFDTVRLRSDGRDRVSVEGTRGEPPTGDLKIGINYLGGYRNSVTFLIPGLNPTEKAAEAEAGLWDLLGGRDQFEEVNVELVRWGVDDPPSNALALSQLRVSVKDPDPAKVGRRFSGAAVELALSSYAGFTLTGPPSEESPFAVYWPTTLPASEVPHLVTLRGREYVLTHTPAETSLPIDVPEMHFPSEPEGPTQLEPLGTLFGARSGDKGGTANLGVWARSDLAYAWLVEHLTVDELKRLLPESAELAVRRYELPNIWALNFVIPGLLGKGVASSTRLDPQAKTLGEYLRAKRAELPISLIEGAKPIQDMLSSEVDGA